MEQIVKDDYFHSPASDGGSGDETTRGRRDAQAFVGEQDGSIGDLNKGKQRMVECEEVEDEDDVRYWVTAKERVEEEEEEEEEEEVVARNQMLWTCDICNTTINIFARDEHCRSAPHLQNAGGTPHAAYDQPPPPPRWRCTVCNEEMSIFQQPSHLFSNPHLKMLLHHSIERHSSPATSERSSTLPAFTDIPPVARSSELEFRNTFYCITCAAEFDRAEQELHLFTTDIWVCEVCSTRMHPAAREAHVESESHAIMKRRSKAPEEDLFCSVCQRVYPQEEMTDHLASALHRNAKSRAEFKEQYLGEKNTASASSGPRCPRTLANQDTTKTWYCDICKQVLESEHLASHLVSHCRIPVPPSRAAEHARPPPARPPPARTEIPSPSVKTLYCDVCKKYIGAQGMAGHKKGRKHKSKAATNGQAKPAKKQAKKPPTGRPW